MINLLPLLGKYWDLFIDGNDQKRIDSQTPPENVDVHSDISYIDDGKWQHLLDVYTPAGNTESLPIIVDNHGGGWMYGTKLIKKYYNMTLAQKGYVVFSINYTLIPDCDIAAQLQDCMAALAWIKKNAKSYHGNLRELYITGDSAGGFLAAYVTMLYNSDVLCEAFDSVSPKLNIRGLGLTCPVCYLDVKGTVGLYTRQMLIGNYEASKYHRLVNLDRALRYSSLPPTYLITCGGDLPAKKATFKAYEDLEDAGVKCKLKYLPDKKLQHVFCITDPFAPISQEVNEDMLKYFKANK